MQLRNAASIFLFLIISPLHSNAQDLSDALRAFVGLRGMGARALAMGGAYTAVSNDYSATFWNPAGLTQLNKSSFYISFGQLSHSADISFGSSSASNFEDSYSSLDGIGVTFKVPTRRGSLVWALGRNTLFGFDNNLLTPTGTSGEVISVLENGGIHAWTGAMGIEISPRTSFGVSINLLRGESEFDFQLSGTSDAVAYNIKADYTGFSMIFGGLYRGDNANFGLKITMPTYYKVDDIGVSSLDDVPANEYSLNMPFKFDVGLSTNLGAVLLAADLHFIDYSQIDFSSDILDTDGIIIDGEINRAVASDLSSNVGYGVGLEYLLPFTNAKIRFGLSDTPSAYKKDEGDDRFALSTGVGMLLDKQIKLDFTYIRTNWERQLDSSLFVQSIKEDAVDGRFLFSISYRY